MEVDFFRARSAPITFVVKGQKKVALVIPPEELFNLPPRKVAIMSPLLMQVWTLLRGGGHLATDTWQRAPGSGHLATGTWQGSDFLF